jgi:tight adherence protein C
VGALLIFLLLPKSSVAWMAFSSLLGATIGYYAPYLYVQNRVQKRRTDLLRSFPDAMDLLVSTVEAGLGLDSAFRRVAEELETAAPDLARELQMVTHEVNSGVPRLEALRHLDDRTGVDEIGALVNVLVQADRFGTSVARALRVHGEHTRTKRMQRAEQAAAKVSPKLTVLMILFILPCLVIVLIGPAIVQVKNIVLPAAGDRGLAP